MPAGIRYLLLSFSRLVPCDIAESAGEGMLNVGDGGARFPGDPTGLHGRRQPELEPCLGDADRAITGAGVMAINFSTS